MSKKDDAMIDFDSDTQHALAYLSGIPVPTSDLNKSIQATDKEHSQFLQLTNVWLKLQQDEIVVIGQTVIEILQGLDLSKKKIIERIESAAYLKLVRKCFRNWSTAESDQKRTLVRNLLINASVQSTSPDSVLSLFIDWLDRYSDDHLDVIKILHTSAPKGLTRKAIWEKLHHVIPGEDSAEADLYKLVIHDLTTGYLIRQHRDKDYHGNFIKSGIKSSSVSSLPNAFDDQKEYVLTALGQQFVSYTLT